MREFCIEIAGKTVGLQTKYANTWEQCEKYLADKNPEIIVSVDPEDIARMRESAVREDALEGKEPQSYSDAYLESLAVYRKICEKMVDYDTVLMHGSVVAVDNQAYLFTAKSGTGKSTHTRYWREVFGERAVMVNDDKPLLKLTEDGVLACGTPWDGKHRLSTNVCLPLRAICILERGETNEITEISAQEALPMVFQQTHRPKNLAKYMEIIDKLTQRVKFYRLHCNMSPDAAKIAYEAMES
jgi:hypothetical protein